MLFDVILGRRIRVTDGLLRVAVSDEGLMRRMRVIIFPVVLRGLTMMPRGLVVMIGSGKVMLHARKHRRHGFAAGLARALRWEPRRFRGGAMVMRTLQFGCT